MRVVSFRIPKTVILPGLVVQVLQVPGKHYMLEGDAGGWEYGDIGDHRARIWLNNQKPLRVRRLTLIHELQHVLIDYLDQAVENYPKIFALKRDLRRKKRRLKARDLVRKRLRKAA